MVKASVMATMPNEPSLRRQNVTEYSLKAQRSQSGKCLQQCRHSECHHRPQASVLQMAIMGTFLRRCSPGLRPTQVHLFPRHPAACPKDRPHLWPAMVVLHKGICPQAFRMLLNSTSQALLPDLLRRRGLALPPALLFLHHLSSMASGGRCMLERLMVACANITTYCKRWYSTRFGCLQLRTIV